MSESIVLTVPADSCGCGCSQPKASKRNFRQGHDRRFMAMLVNAELAGRKIDLITGSVSARPGGLENQSPDHVARLFLNERGVDQYQDYLDKAKNRKPKGRKTAKPEQDRPGIGNTIRVKVGRWEYDAAISHMNSAGKVTAVEYYNKVGNVVVAEKFTIV